MVASATMTRCDSRPTASLSVSIASVTSSAFAATTEGSVTHTSGRASTNDAVSIPRSLINSARSHSAVIGDDALTDASISAVKMRLNRASRRLSMSFACTTLRSSTSIASLVRPSRWKFFATSTAANALSGRGAMASSTVLPNSTLMRSEVGRSCSS